MPVPTALAFFFLNMDAENCYKIGWIVKPHGLKGEVTLSLEDDAPDDLDTLEAVFLDQNSRLVPYFIESISGQGNKAFVKFEDVNTHDEALRISRQSVFLEKSKRPPAEPNQFYDDEIIGFEVEDQNLGGLGTISQIIQAGPNKLLEVTSESGKEILIPVNGPFILNINKDEKTVLVDLPEGFLDL